MADKEVLIFEPHTAMIIKDRRDTYYIHKICLTGVTSNMILDCIIFEGKRADTDLSILMLERQKEFYGKPLLKSLADGGFAPKNNLKNAKELGVKYVCFTKKRGLDELGYVPQSFCL